MARHVFGGSRADWAMLKGDAVLDEDTVVGYVPYLLPNQVVTLWEQRTGGGQITDIVELGSTDPVSPLEADSDGNIPRFRGPDGIRRVWASASSDGSSTRYAMVAIDLGEDIADLDTRVSTLESGGVGSAVPETLRFAAATVTVAQAADPPPAHRAYNLTGSPQSVESIHASAGVAPAGGPLEFDVRVDGASVFADTADRPTIATEENTSSTVSPTASATVPAGGYVTVVPTAGDDTAEGVTVAVRVV